MVGKELPPLRIEIGRPCGADWDAMSGDARVRRCQHCDRNVYNLSELKSQEVRELVRSTEKRVCGRLYRRPDGTAVTRDCNDHVRPTSAFQYSIRGLLFLLTSVALTFAAFPWIRRTVGPMITAWFEPQLPTVPTPFEDPTEWVMGEYQIIDEPIEPLEDPIEP